MTNPRRQSSHHRARSVSSAARSCRPCVSVSSPGADTWEKKQYQSVTICAVTNKVETRRTHLLHMSKSLHHMRKSHSDAVEITLKKQVSLASIRLRGIVIAPNRKRHSYCDVTTIRQTRRFRFWRRQISKWRRRWSRQTGGTAFFSILDWN